MKKLFYLWTLSALFFSCGSNKSQNSETTADESNPWGLAVIEEECATFEEEQPKVVEQMVEDDTPSPSKPRTLTAVYEYVNGNKIVKTYTLTIQKAGDCTLT